MATGIAVGLVMAVWAAAWLPVAYRADKTFLAEQMMEKFGTAKVIPAVADFFIWADILWLPWILGYIVAKEHGQWSRWDVTIMVALSFVLTCLFHRFAILTGEWPATLGWKGGHTLNGWLHVPYMTAALAILGLHFFRSAVDPQVAFVVGLALLVQIVLDLHVPMKFIQGYFHFDWYPSILVEDTKQIWMLVGGLALVVALTTLTGGLFSSFGVLVAACVLGVWAILG